MSWADEYLENAIELLKKVKEDQRDKIVKAAEMTADSVENGGMLFVFGTGHSHMLAEELFYRAGGLVDVYPILEESLMLHNGAAKSSDIERLEGYAAIILKHTPIKRGDTIIIASNSGRNALTVEMATESQKLGANVIALTSLAHSTAQAPRHSSGKKLYEVADLVIDNQSCVGDASVRFDEIGKNVGATSSVVGCAILEAIVCEAVGILINRGKKPNVYLSSNVSGGDEVNEAYFEKYTSKIKPL